MSKVDAMGSDMPLRSVRAKVRIRVCTTDWSGAELIAF